MQRIYDYYGLELFFGDETSLPIIVYARRGQYESRALIRFENGLLLPYELLSSKNELDKKDMESFIQLLEKNAGEIIKFWLDIFLYCKPFQTEIIKTKLEGS